MNKNNQLDFHAAKVVSALISNGYYPSTHFDISRAEDCCEINLLRLTQSPYSTMKIYSDGFIQYISGGSVQFEGVTKHKDTIISDVFHK